MKFPLSIIVIVFLLLAAACDRQPEQSPPVDSPTTDEHGPTAGAETFKDPHAGLKPRNQNKLVFAFQPQENPAGMTPDARKLADFLSEKIGMEVEIFIPTSYAAVVEAMRANHAQVAYFSGWPYLVAHMRADADLLVVEERGGVPTYWSQWYVRKDSPIRSVKDLKGKTIAFTSPSSTSGYLFPAAKLVEEGVLQQDQDPKEVFENVLFAGGYEAALKSLAHGNVDAAAASDYAFTMYLTEEEQAGIRVISRQGPVPTHGIAIRADQPQDVKDKVKQALLSLNEAENQELLRSVYGAEKLVERSHYDHVHLLEKAQEVLGVDYPL